MHHATPLITTIVGGLVLAFILGMIANKLRISPLVGYLLAGVLAGPFTPGFVADTKTGAGAGGARRDSIDVRRRAAFFAEGFDGGKVYRHSRRCRSDSGGDAAGYGAFRRAGMVINDRHRFWALSVYRQYRRPAARA